MAWINYLRFYKKQITGNYKIKIIFLFRGFRTQGFSRCLMGNTLNCLMTTPLHFKTLALLGLAFIIDFSALAQNYSSYLTGNTTDLSPQAFGGVCLMGGASEDDEAMKWFLRRANGGDVLVLRTSGSNGYNVYLYSDLGIGVNSVETIVCHHSDAANEPYVLQKIAQAEAIWIAGGDQWNYLNEWRNTPLNQALNTAILQRNVVIGGTSAGMAVMGQHQFTAQNGTIVSADALSNPFDSRIALDTAAFLHNHHLQNTITDTHFDNPDRKGRLVVFLARLLTSYGTMAKAIACDEYTAVCIDTNGTAHVYGGHPNYDDNAYFIQTNCELPQPAPETCVANQALNWNLGAEALKVYQVKGNASGSNTFNLNTWQNGQGGQWRHWWVNQGVFNEQSGSPIVCSGVSIEESALNSQLQVFPNPAYHWFSLKLDNESIHNHSLVVYNSQGQKMPINSQQNGLQIDLFIAHWPAGIYQVVVNNTKGKSRTQRLLKPF